MKSLTYFSKLNQNKDNKENADIGLDIQSLKDSMESKGRQLSESMETKPSSVEQTTADELSEADKTVQSQDEVQPLEES